MHPLDRAARVVHLTRTVSLHGIAYERLCVREMNDHDLRPAPVDMADEDVARLLISRACRAPLEVVRALSPADEARVLDLVEPMLRANIGEVWS